MRSLAFVVLAAALLLASRERSPAADAPGEIGGKALEKWIELTKSKDPSVRENAIRTIVQFGKDGQKALPVLVTCLSDPDVGVSSNAIIAFRALSTEKDLKNHVDVLTRLLQKGSTVGQIHAALALAQLGPDAKAALRTLSETTIKAGYSWELRKTAALALGRVAFTKSGPDPTVVRALADTLTKDACSQVRLQAIMSLGTLNAHKVPSGAQIVKHPLDLVVRNDSDQAVGIWARVLLAQMDGAKPEPYLEFLHKQMLKNADPQMRVHAVQALAVLGPLAKSRIPSFIDLLKDENASVAEAAAGSLGQFKDMLGDSHIAEVAKLLQDKGERTRGLAAQALSTLGDKSKAHIPAVIDLLKDAGTANAATAAIGQWKNDLTDAHVHAVAKLLADKEPITKCQAARLLALLGAKAKTHIPALITALQDADVDVVTCAIVALAAFGKDADKAVPALTKLKDHKDEDVKASVAKAIEEITGKPLK